MSRAYKGVRPQHNRVYSVGDVLELYSCSRNTLSNWVGIGLRPSPSPGQQLFRGSELARFHEIRRAKSRKDLANGEFLCVACKAAVAPFPSAMEIGTQRNPNFATGRCPDCGATVHKILNDTECTALKNARDHNTSAEFPYEYKVSFSARIWKIEAAFAEKQPSCNDRVLYAWQGYAGRFDVKTVQAHMVAIREFEQFCSVRPFVGLRSSDVSNYRNRLVELSKTGHFSASTVRHRCAQLASFLVWLRMQEGFRNLPQDLKDCLALPKSFHQLGQTRQRAYPTLEEARGLLEAMSKSTLLARRNRALFALACTSGLRANALITLRRHHVDAHARTVHQDAALMRAKNGKSFLVHWFPRTEDFAEVLIAYLAEIDALGMQRNDALFPSAAGLEQLRHRGADRTNSLQVMETSNAVTEAFRQACETHHDQYSPHSVRDMLANLGEQICTTTEALKAWSLNLGHSRPATTQNYYAKMTDEKRSDVLRAINANGAFSVAEKDLMLDYHQHRLIPGSPEFMRAQKLVKEREEGNMAGANAEDSDALVE